MPAMAVPNTNPATTTGHESFRFLGETPSSQSNEDLRLRLNFRSSPIVAAREAVDIQLPKLKALDAAYKPQD